MIFNCFCLRYDGVLYYGCTDPATMSGGKKMCATDTNSDYDALEMADCDDTCQIQSKKITLASLST